jgi:hypothetical protein
VILHVAGCHQELRDEKAHSMQGELTWENEGSHLAGNNETGLWSLKI